MRDTNMLAPPMSDGRPVNLVRWGAVWSGVLVGLGFLALFSSLWLAWGYGSNNTTFSDNIQWWLGGATIAAVFVGGLVSALVSGVRGLLAGFLNSTVLWALITTVGIIVELGFATNHVNSTHSVGGLADQLPQHGLWPTFWSLLVGLGAATLGGVLGGAAHRATKVPQRVDRTDAHDRTYPREQATHGETLADHEVAGRHRV